MAGTYRADHLGSLLRPGEVKQARLAFHEGRLSRGQSTEVEGNAILDGLEQHKRVGVDMFSDGEFRRLSFQNDLAESVEGYVESERPAVV